MHHYVVRVVLQIMNELNITHIYKYFPPVVAHEWNHPRARFRIES